MAESTTTSGLDGTATTNDAPRAHFAKAVEEARAGAQLLGKQAQDMANTYRDKLNQTTTDWSSGAKAKSDQTVDRAFQLANDGKARASSAILGLGKMVEENAALVDERVGVQYGDYVRTAGRSIQDVANQFDAKELSELAEDAREFVRTRPGVAIGLAAVGGFMLARMFKGSDD